MNSLPPSQRGVGRHDRDLPELLMVLSIGIFFTLIILGLSASLPASLMHA